MINIEKILWILVICFLDTFMLFFIFIEFSVLVCITNVCQKNMRNKWINCIGTFSSPVETNSSLTHGSCFLQPLLCDALFSVWTLWAAASFSGSSNWIFHHLYSNISLTSEDAIFVMEKCIYCQHSFFCIDAYVSILCWTITYIFSSFSQCFFFCGQQLLIFVSFDYFVYAILKVYQVLMFVFYC